MGATQVGLLKPSDWPAVRHIFDEGIATATSETTTPPRLPRRAPTASHR